MTDFGVKDRFGIQFAYRAAYTLLLAGIGYGFARNAGIFAGSLLFQCLGLIVSLLAFAAVDCARGKGPLLVVCGICAAVSAYAWRYLPAGVPAPDGQEEKQRLLSAPALKELSLVVLLAVAVCLVWMLAERFFWLRLGMALPVMAYPAACMVLERQLFRFCTAAALSYLAAVTLELVQRGWNKKKQGGDRAYVLWLIPFLALYFLLIRLMPAPEAPYDWALVKSLYRRVQEEVRILSQSLFWGGEEFGLSTSGFSEKADLSGDVAEEQRFVMQLTGWPRSGNGVYLTGRVYAVFDGRQWLWETGGERDQLMDTLETLYAVERYDGEHAFDYVKRTELEAVYKYIHTRYLFAPLKTDGIEGYEEDKDYRADGTGLLFRRTKHYGASYRFWYYQMNLKHPDFIRMLEEGGMPESEEAWERVVRARLGRTADVPLQDLFAYRARLRERYAAAPDLSPAVQAWLDTLTEGAETDYEKLRRLEEALRAFSYNARPGELPEEVDSAEGFLDYFLMQSREGYCSYFATAFVLLARAEGIPARYVQGFCVPGQARNGWEEKETAVFSYMAHAWPEAYLEGVGWIPFEPTPGFGAIRDVSWKTTGDRRQEQEAAQEAHGDAGWQEPDAEKATEDGEEPVQEEKKELSKDWLFAAAWLAAGAAVLFALFLCVDALWERIADKKRSDGERFRLEALRNLQILEALGYRREDGETLAELAGRASCGQTFIRDCEEVLYGGRGADAETAKKVCGYRPALLEELKRKKGRGYLFYKVALYIKRARK